jgi:TP901 family phage tail tape measure protein
MSREIQAGRASVFIEANRKRLAAGLAAAQKQLQTFAAGAAKVGAGALAGSAAMFAPMAAAVKHFADTGGALDDMAQRTGASVEALSGLGYAAQMSGSSLEDVEKGIRKVQQGVSAGSSVFGELGLSIESLQSMSPDQQFAAIADKLAAIENPGERAAKAMEVFGKSGANLLPLLSTGSKGIEELTEQAAANGAVMSGEQAQSAAALGDAIDGVGISFGGLVNTIGAQLAPVLTTILGLVTYAINRSREWIAANQGIVITIGVVAAVLAVLGAGLVTAAGLAYGLSVAIAAVGAVASAVGTVLGVLGTILTGGIGVAIAAVVIGLAGLGAYLLYTSNTGGAAMDWLSGKFQMLSDIAGPVFKGIQDAMAGGNLGLAAEIAWQGIQLAWSKGTADIRAAWDQWFNGLLQKADEFIVQFRSKWNDVSGWLADRMLEAYGTFDSSFDAETAKQMRREDTNRQNNSFAAGVQDRAAGRDAAAKEAEQKRMEAIAALEEKLAANVAKAASEAATAAERSEKASQGVFDPEDMPETDKPTGRDSNQSLETDTSANVGTSSGFAAALMGMGGGPSVDLELLAESKKQSEYLGELLAQAEQQTADGMNGLSAEVASKELGSRTPAKRSIEEQLIAEMGKSLPVLVGIRTACENFRERAWR